MNNKSDEMIVNGASPSIIWTQYMDLLSEYAKYMKSIYTKRMRANKPITWNDLDVLNKQIHDQLDYKMTWNEKFNQPKVTESIQRKNKVIRLSESKLYKIIKKCVNEALNVNGEYDSVDAEDLYGCVIEWGSDPHLIEDMEEAQSMADVINGSPYRGVIYPEDEDYERACTCLGGDIYGPIYTFVNGSAGSFAKS